MVSPMYSVPPWDEYVIIVWDRPNHRLADFKLIERKMQKWLFLV